MPIFDGDIIISVLEIVTTYNLTYDGFYEMMSEVCKALQEVGLKSLFQNENINYDISKDYSSLAKSSRSRKSKTFDVTCNDITKLFGMPKEIARETCDIKLSENTFTKAHRQFGISTWPCERQGVAKSSAHNALELGREYHTNFFNFNENQIQEYERRKDLLMKDDDDTNFEDAVVENYNYYLLSKDEHNESLNIDFLNIYKPAISNPHKPAIQRSCSTSSRGKQRQELHQNESGFVSATKSEGMYNLNRFGSYIPSLFHPYIKSIQDVRSDGNCGFRSVAVGLGFDEDRWVFVRQQLLQEMDIHMDSYKYVFDGMDPGLFDRLRHSINWFDMINPAPSEHWMLMPYTGLVVAQRFGVIVHLFSEQGCQTFFPLWLDVAAVPQRNVVCLVHLPMHFIHLKLEGDYPIPTVSVIWKRNNNAAREWEELYEDRIKQYTDIIERNKEVHCHNSLHELVSAYDTSQIEDIKNFHMRNDDDINCEDILAEEEMNYFSNETTDDTRKAQNDEVHPRTVISGYEKMCFLEPAQTADECIVDGDGYHDSVQWPKETLKLVNKRARTKSHGGDLRNVSTSSLSRTLRNVPTPSSSIYGMASSQIHAHDVALSSLYIPQQLQPAPFQHENLVNHELTNTRDSDPRPITIPTSIHVPKFVNVYQHDFPNSIWDVEEMFTEEDIKFWS